jgi:hypothetical protein
MNIQFYVSVSGKKTAKEIVKEVAEIVAYRDALKAAGIDLAPAPAPSRPMIARSAAPSFSTDKSPECEALEAQWAEMTGKGFRCSPEMAAMFNLPPDRAGRIARMIELVKSGQAIRTVSGWMPTGETGEAGEPMEDDGGDVLG